MKKNVNAIQSTVDKPEIIGSVLMFRGRERDKQEVEVNSYEPPIPETPVP